MVDVVAVIPARAGSKTVPDKNIKLLAGRPLIAYSIATGRLARNIERVIVSTDSEHYANIAREYGAEVPFLRPAEISGDRSTDYEFIKHLLDWMQDNEGKQPKYLVHLRPTAPLREVSYVEEAIRLMRENDSATALRSVQEMPQSAYKSFELEKGYLKCVGSGSMNLDMANRPRQEYKKTYDPNSYVDVIRVSYVLENRRIHGDRVLAYIIPPIGPIGEFNTLEDFAYLEYLVAKDPTIVKRLFGGIFE